MARIMIGLIRMNVVDIKAELQRGIDMINHRPGKKALTQSFPGLIFHVNKTIASACCLILNCLSYFVVNIYKPWVFSSLFPDLSSIQYDLLCN